MIRRFVGISLFALAVSSAGLGAIGAAQPVDKLEVHDIAAGSHPALAATADGKLHAVFEGVTPGTPNADIYYSQSSDGGNTWADPVDISRTKEVSSHPDIAVEKDGSVDVVWSDTSQGAKSRHIFFAQASDGGKTWSDPKDISNTLGVSEAPKIAVGPDGTIHVVWTDTSTGSDILYTASKDGGKTWGECTLVRVDLISDTPGNSYEPNLTVDADKTIHVAWADTTVGDATPDVYYRRASSGHWSDPIDVSKTDGKSSHPAIASGGGKVILAWSDNLNKADAPDIFLDTGKDGKFTGMVNLSDSPAASVDPSLTADDRGRICVVWSEMNPKTTQAIICERTSLDGGKNFTSTRDLSNAKALSTHSRVTICGDKAFVLWEETSGNNRAIKAASWHL